MSLRLLNGIAAPTTAPTLATDGFPLEGDQVGTPTREFYWIKRWNRAAIAIAGAGTGALTFQGVLWVYQRLPNAWMPLGIGAMGVRGMLNDGTTISGTSTVVHTQPVYGISPYDRIALQATTATGTGLVLSAYLIPMVQEG